MLRRYLRRWCTAKPGKVDAECEKMKVGLGSRVILEWEDSNPLLRLRRRAKLTWKSAPERVLVVKKWNCRATTDAAAFAISWLLGRKMDVLVEEACLKDFPTLNVRGAKSNFIDSIDLIVVLGGDGTLLHTSRLFSAPNCGPLPPCVTFGLGSLGFMSNFSLDKWSVVMERVLGKGGSPLYATLRTRLLCEVKDHDNKDVILSQKVLNDVVICQPTGYGKLGKFNLYVDGHSITLVEGDGLIVSTPSGSTSYNMSCGGAMVAPSVPVTLLTPIAPSSLSFRPILINEQSRVDVVLPVKSRSPTAQIVCDGQLVCNLQPGQRVSISTSKFPLPVINLRKLDHDWLDGITSKLNWNTRVVNQADS
eukprot:TRINITY_DN33782_c0_g1_i1.p1 TRINITY_DN33782_c0_g1~~TRINITY_DN33782_c0_g1_i1.p1  ORF type:complete len:363 (+),score=41.88 TRINITY_DN33782_c0_g1_i1:41-1129(+)